MNQSLFCPNCGVFHPEEGSRGGLPFCDSEPQYCDTCGRNWHQTQFCLMFTLMRAGGQATRGSGTSNFQQIHAVRNSGAGHVGHGRGSAYRQGESPRTLLGRGGIQRQSVHTTRRVNTQGSPPISHLGFADAIEHEFRFWGQAIGGVYTEVASIIRIDDARERPILTWHSEQPFEQWSRAERFRMFMYLCRYPGVQAIRVGPPSLSPDEHSAPPTTEHLTPPAQPQVSEFRCNICNKSFLQQQSLHHHKAAKHSSQSPIKQEAVATDSPASKRVRTEFSSSASLASVSPALNETQTTSELSRAMAVLAEIAEKSRQDALDRELRNEQREQREERQREEFRQHLSVARQELREERSRLDKQSLHRDEIAHQRSMEHVNSLMLGNQKLVNTVCGNQREELWRTEVRSDRRIEQNTAQYKEQAKTERQMADKFIANDKAGHQSRVRLLQDFTNWSDQHHKDREQLIGNVANSTVQRSADEAAVYQQAIMVGMDRLAQLAIQARANGPSVTNNFHAGSITTANLDAGHAGYPGGSENSALSGRAQAQLPSKPGEGQDDEDMDDYDFDLDIDES